MMAGYRQAGLTAPATFELYTRRLPPDRSFLVAAGLEQALDFLESLRFEPGDIAYLRDLPQLAGAGAAFFDEYLPRFRFTGEVWAVAEGTPVFPPEPMLRVTAPLSEAQLVETALLAFVTFETTVASKAARVSRGGGRPVGRRVRRTARARRRGGRAGRARRLSRRVRRHVERRGRAPVRHPRLGHHGALLGAGVSRRGVGVPRLHRLLRRARGAAARHLRHAGRRAARRRGRPAAVGRAAR